MNIRFRSDGTCIGVYDDLARDLLPGTLSVDRASNVEFVPELQVWRAVEVGTGKILAEAPLRQDCLDQEKAYLERKLHGD